MSFDFNKYKHKRIKLTKLKDEVFDGTHPNGIYEGFTYKGRFLFDNSVFYQSIILLDKDSHFHTSTVVEITEHDGYDLVRTMNSIYKLEIISKSKRK